MSNQEMQFADPDWKPSQKLDTKTGAQEQETYNPQPINADHREQSQEKIAPPQQDVYAGLPPYAGTAPQRMQGGGFRQQQYRRRARGPLFWIILAFIIISLMGGGFGSAFNRGFNPPDFGRMGQFHPNDTIVEPAQNFTVSSISPPTVVINGDGGIINVHTGTDANSVVVQDTKNPGPFGDTNDIQVTSSQNGNSITTNVQDSGRGSVDFNVTVPQGADLQLTTTGSGSISIDSVTLSGTSTITTDSGNINFNGTIGTSGAAQFTTSNGTIDFTAPADSSFYLNASTNSGSMTNDFPNVKQTNNQGGTQAIGNVGTVSHGQGATVTLHTDNGDINLHQGS
jgi:hypothetical protein